MTIGATWPHRSGGIGVTDIHVPPPAYNYLCNTLWHSDARGMDWCTDRWVAAPLLFGERGDQLAAEGRDIGDHAAPDRVKRNRDIRAGSRSHSISSLE